MIQLNLLPDVKMQYIRARQRKRMVMGLSIITSSVFLVLFIFLLLFVRVIQKQHLSALDKDISQVSSELKSKQDLDKILTIQNQLNSLPGLHDQKIIGSRLVDYLTQVTPVQATISDVTSDFEANTLSVKGNADALSTVNKFADTLKFTDFKTGEKEPRQGKAFSNVVLKSFAVGGANSQGQEGITYELEFSFDPIIFANIKDAEASSEVSLIIPKIISTRSETEKPDDLFVPQPDEPITETGR
ncbi:MAG TPA: hypothetical protein VD947_02615 [Patescibacteria group bacterium]|nr:hypothetical protein [Patescibacteria group bacterium]